jgi:hypothetical protein
MKHHFPPKLTIEFLLIELVNNLDKIAEERDSILQNIKEKISQLGIEQLQQSLSLYANVSTKKVFAEFLN